jgi:G3E family GTPase
MDGNSGGFDESVIYIYEKQLEEASVIVLNKMDLVNKEELTEIVKLVNEKYSNKIVLLQNSQDETSIQQWIRTLDNDPATGLPRSLKIDYDVYAAGEAKLAWLDQQLEIISSENNAVADAEFLINAIFKQIKNHHEAVEAPLPYFVCNVLKCY